MPSLSVNFCGIKMDNPFIIASSPATESIKSIIKCAKAGAGAIITKSIADYDVSIMQLGARRTHFGSHGFWATSTFRRETLPRCEGISLVSETSSQVTIPIIASVTATSLNPDYWVPTCLDLQAAGASMIQLDLFYLPQPVCKDSSLEDLLILFDVLSKTVSVPVIPKLNIEIPAYLAAHYFTQSKIAGLSLLDSIRVPSPIDITQKGIPFYQFVEKPGMSSVFGSWQLPLTQHYTMILGRLTNLPICAGGGLSSAHDALELIMLGATTVQYATAVLINGFGFIEQLAIGLGDLLDKLGFETISEIRGLALESQRTDIEVAAPDFKKAKAIIDNDKCNKCKRCLDLAFCNAIVESGDRIYINNDSLCDGCGFCVHFCKSMAINLE